MAGTIALQNGALGFSAISDGDGPLVLCLHGFPDCKRSFRHQLPALADAGFRAVSVSLRGYEPASRPVDNDYSLASMASDVIGFLNQLKVERAHLVGHDWGAAIAYTAAATAPERFNSLTALSVPHSGRFVNEAFMHLRQARLSWYMLFFQLRGIADYVVEKDDYAFIRTLWRDWSPGWAFPEDEFAAVLETFRQPGVKTAALAYYRETFSPKNWPLGTARRAANRFAIPVPTLAITGAIDHCIDSDIFKKLMYEQDFPSGLKVATVAEAGHFPHQEQPEKVNALLLAWLEAHKGEPEATA